VEGFEIPTATPIELEFADNHDNGPVIEGWRYLSSTTAREVA
jgi:hypothetical protein